MLDALSYFLAALWGLALAVGRWPAGQRCCLIISDPFTVNDLAGNYSQRSGSWSIASGVLTTSSAGAVLRCEVAGVTGHGKATVSVKLDTNGGKARLIGALVDDDNYLFAELTRVSGSSAILALWKRAGGAETQLGASIPAAFNFSFAASPQLCWNGSTATALLGFGGLTESYTGTGTKAGLGASPNGGTATFDDFALWQNATDDPTCPTCTGCPTICSPEATTMSVSFVGFTDTSVFCADRGVTGRGCISNPCSAYDGYTFVVPRTSACNFDGSFSPAICDSRLADQVSGVFTTFGGDTFADVCVTPPSQCDFGLGGYAWGFRSASLGPSPIDCSSISGISLPYDSAITFSLCNGFGFPAAPNAGCNGTGVICTLSTA